MHPGTPREPETLTLHYEPPGAAGRHARWLLDILARLRAPAAAAPRRPWRDGDVLATAGRAA